MIKFIGNFAEHTDRYGNTYFKGTMISVEDGATLEIPYQYGYGNHYQDMAFREMVNAGWVEVGKVLVKYGNGGENMVGINYFGWRLIDQNRALISWSMYTFKTMKQVKAF